MTAHEGKRWAVLHVIGYGPNRSGIYFHHVDVDGKARLVDDRYRAKTWAKRETAEAHARSLGPRYEAVEVYL